MRSSPWRVVGLRHRGAQRAAALGVRTEPVAVVGVGRVGVAVDDECDRCGVLRTESWRGWLCARAVEELQVDRIDAAVAVRVAIRLAAHGAAGPVVARGLPARAGSIEIGFVDGAVTIQVTRSSWAARSGWAGGASEGAARLLSSSSRRVAATDSGTPRDRRMPRRISGRIDDCDADTQVTATERCEHEIHRRVPVALGQTIRRECCATGNLNRLEGDAATLGRDAHEPDGRAIEEEPAVDRAYAAGHAQHSPN